MLKNTIVDNDQTTLEEIVRAMQELSEDKFIEGVALKHHDEFEIQQTADMIKEYQCRINREARALVKYSEDFIRQFATDNNKCYETAENLFGKIRSTLACLLKIFKKTTPNQRHKKGVYVVSKQPFYKKSKLSAKQIQQDLFGLKSFPDSAHDLYNALDTLFSTSTAMLTLCHQIIEKEKETREDPVLLRQIYDRTCNELMNSFGAFREFISPTQELPENAMEECRKKAKTEAEFLRNEYHMHDRKVMTTYLVINNVKQARCNGLTEQEAFFWHKNTSKALAVRKVIDNFDLIQNLEGQKGKLSPQAIVEFLKWCGVEECFEKRLYNEYFKPRYLAKGKLKPIGWSTISGVRKDLKDMDVTDQKLARDFAARLTDILTPEELAA